MPASAGESRTGATPPADAPSSTRSDIDAFLARAKATAPATGGARGRLIFALDATMSRQPTWDKASHIQGEMFAEAAAVGGLDMQLVYFRGFGECRASKWLSDGARLGDMMSRIDCRAGRTQISKVLARALDETRKSPVQALVYVGDAMEENIDLLGERAGQLGMLRVPIFIFQERRDPAATRAFAEMARLSKGAHLTLDGASGAELARLLKAVAVYAAGGVTALSDRSAKGDGGARLLLEKLS
ncbi:hypothetical protein [Acuticoccus yangtzensis]|uniref:hypothetical protein n=1 Tax=Acuticoccus yangtzensis TaxID=1443441 RepID=UPI0009498093|nr:hypothetical protein [Acuticoccus yangtzensis]